MRSKISTANVCVAFGIGLHALYGPLAAEAVRIFDPIQMALLSLVLSGAITSALAAVAVPPDVFRRAYASEARPRIIRDAASTAIFSILSTFFFLLSLHLLNDIIAVILFEAWPIFGFLLFFRLVGGNPSQRRAYEVHIYVLATAGLGIMMAPSFYDAWTSSTTQLGEIAFGVAAGIAASYCTAMTIAKGRLLQNLTQITRMRHAIILTEALKGGLIFVGLLFPCAFFVDWAAVTPQVLIVALILRTVLTPLVSSFEALSYFYSISRRILVLWYFAPVVAIILISLQSDEVLYDVLFVGAFLVILSNVFLNADYEPQKSFVAFVVSVAVATVLCNFIPPRSSQYYFEIISVLFAIQSIFLSFVLLNGAQRSQTLAETVEQKLESIAGDDTTLRQSWIAHLFEEADPPANHGAHPTAVEEMSRLIARYSFGSLQFSLRAFSAMTLFIAFSAIAFRPVGLEIDLFAVLVVSISVALLVQAQETSTRDYLASYLRQKIGDDIYLARVKSAQFVNTLVLVIVLAFATALFLDKYATDLMQPFFG